MEHWCRSCGHMEFNNGSLLVCPRCQGEDILSVWDEQDAHDYDEPEEESEDMDDE